MKSKRMRCATVIGFLVLLVLPVQLAAQDKVRYKLIDLGTLGGAFRVLLVRIVLVRE